MTAPTPTAFPRTTTAGGALLALAGLLQLVAFEIARDSALLPLASVALAIGLCVLAVGLGGGGIAGASRVGRIALLVVGIGSLVADLLPLAAVPAAVLVGMTLIWLLAAATVVAAVVVARAGGVRGLARWPLLAVAGWALLAAIVSTVPTGRLPFLFAEWRLELLLPLALLVAGVAFVLHGRAAGIRHRLRVVDDAWRRTTDVGGSASQPLEDAAPRR